MFNATVGREGWWTKVAKQRSVADDARAGKEKCGRKSLPEFNPIIAEGGETSFAEATKPTSSKGQNVRLLNLSLDSSSN